MDTIKAVIVTLNKLEVHGEQNLNYLLGCIQALTNIVNGDNSNGENDQAE